LETSDGCYFEHLTKDGKRQLTHYISLSYHTSWDWLMTVVEKIEGFKDSSNDDLMEGYMYNIRIEQYFVYILNGQTMDVIIEMNGISKIDATYKAVVQFIKQLNK